MVKVHIAHIATDGSMSARVILSNGDELTLLTAVEVSSQLESINVFKIEGYIGGGSKHEDQQPE